MSAMGRVAIAHERGNRFSRRREEGSAKEYGSEWNRAIEDLLVTAI